MSKINYYDHIKSDYWCEVRRAVWRRSEGCCERCGTNYGRRDVHHLTYEYLGRELDYLFSVKLLCEDCHRFVHGKSSFDMAKYMGGDINQIKIKMRELGL